MRQLLSGNEGTIEKSMGNFLQTASIIGPQICLLCEMMIYAILYKSNRCHNDQMKGSLSNRNIRERYRKNTITLSGQMLSFFAKIVLYILAFILLRFRKAFNMDNLAFNHCVNIVFRSLIALSLIVASPELRREYFGHRVKAFSNEKVQTPTDEEFELKTITEVSNAIQCNENSQHNHSGSSNISTKRNDDLRHLVQKQ